MPLADHWSIWILKLLLDMQVLKTKNSYWGHIGGTQKQLAILNGLHGNIIMI